MRRNSAPEDFQQNSSKKGLLPIGAILFAREARRRENPPALPAEPESFPGGSGKQSDRSLFAIAAKGIFTGAWNVYTQTKAKSTVLYDATPARMDEYKEATSE